MEVVGEVEMQMPMIYRTSFALGDLSMNLPPGGAFHEGKVRNAEDVVWRSLSRTRSSLSFCEGRNPSQRFGGI